MDETITIQVNLKKFIRTTDKDDVIIVRKGNGWIGVSKDEFLKEYKKEIDELKAKNKELTTNLKNIENKFENTKKELDSKVQLFEKI